MTVFLTGGSGMLGSRIVESFNYRYGGESIVAPTRKELDLTNGEEVLEYIKRIKPRAVIHAAAKVGGIAANVANPLEFLSENVKVNQSVIGAAHAAGINELIFIGSSCMYPKNIDRPILEEDLLTAPLEPTNEGYALSKILGLKHCQYISLLSNRAYRTIVPCNLFGPGDNFSINSSHLIASVIRKVAEAVATQSKTIDVWGSGNARREFLFVDDLVQGIFRVLDDISNAPNVLNMGHGSDLSVKEWYERVLRIAGCQAELKYDRSKPEGMFRKLVSSELAISRGYLERSCIDDCLELTYKNYINRAA